MVMILDDNNIIMLPTVVVKKEMTPGRSSDSLWVIIASKSVINLE